MSTPNTSIAVSMPERKASALGLMASRLNVEPQKLLATLKATVFRNATDDELLALVVVSNEYGLNPLLKEIYAFPAKGGGIVPVVSVDGWVRMTNDHKQMDGLDFDWGYSPEGQLESCTSIYYRKDRSRPIRVTEYLSECKRNTEPWKMEHRMLRHKALIQGARVAFGFSGVMDEDDAERITIDVEPAKPAQEVLPAAASATRKPREIKPVEAGATVAATPKAERTLQERLSDLVTVEAGCTFDHFTTTARELNLLTGKDEDATGFSELSDDICTKCLAAHRGLKAALAVAKEGGAK